MAWAEEFLPEPGENLGKKEEIKVKYFISYAYYQQGAPYFGNAEWEGGPIVSLEQITQIEEEVRRQIQEKETYVKLLFWRPLEGE